MGHEVLLTETFVESLEQCETLAADRIVTKLEDIDDVPGHFLDRLTNHPGYELRVGDFRVLPDWDKESETIYAVDVFERKKDSGPSGPTARSGARGATRSEIVQLVFDGSTAQSPLSTDSATNSPRWSFEQPGS